MKLSSVLICLYTLLLISCDTSNHRTTYNRKSIELEGLAIALIQNSQYDTALVLLDQAINIDKTYYLAYAYKVVIFTDLQDFNRAISESKILLKIKPDFAEGWQFEGMIYDSMGDSINAIKDYKRSIELFDQRISDTKKEKYVYNDKLNKAVSFILARQEKIGYDSLRKIKEQFPDQTTADVFLKLSRKDLLNQFINKK